MTHSPHTTSGKKAVLFVVPSLRRAGAETQLVDLANGLSATAYSKSIFTYRKFMDQFERLDTDNIKFFNSIRAHKLDFSPVRELSRIIDEQEIDIIHCTLQFSVLLAWVARRFSERKPKIVAAVHTTVNQRPVEEVLDRLVHCRLLRACDKVVFVCNSQMAYWLKKFPALKANSCFVYNGVDLSHYDPQNCLQAAHFLRLELCIPQEATVISAIAGFRKEKGHRYLIEAFRSLPQACFLVLAGDGVERPAIEQLVSRYGLVGRVKFLGNIDDVRPLLKMSDLTVLASTAVETFSIAMLESMAMETPVAGSDIGGMAEAVIAGKTGFLFPPANVEALQNVLMEAAGNRPLLRQLGTNARALVMQNFTCEKMVEQTAVILQ